MIKKSYCTLRYRLPPATRKSEAGSDEAAPEVAEVWILWLHWNGLNTWATDFGDGPLKNVCLTPDSFFLKKVEEKETRIKDVLKSGLGDLFHQRLDRKWEMDHIRFQDVLSKSAAANLESSKNN